MKLFKYLLIVCLIMKYGDGFTQKGRIKFERLNVENGLSNGNVLSILQDSKGLMWFGTRDGLNRYDGYKFTIYKNEFDNTGSIIDNYVNSLMEDEQGMIWAATWGGLSRFDRKLDRFTNFVNNEKDPNSIASNLLTVVTEDKERKIWIGTDNKGLDMYDPSSNKFTHYQHTVSDTGGISSNHIADIFEDSMGNLWIATDSGLNLFNRHTKKFQHFIHEASNNNSLSSNDLYDIFEDSHHNFWIGTNGSGLELFDRKTATAKHYRQSKLNSNSISEDVVYTLGEDGEGNLWIGTESTGICIYDVKNGVFTNYANDELDYTSPGNNAVYSIFRDRNKNMWVGTFFGGISMMNVDMHLFAHYKHNSLKNSLGDSHVLSMCEDARKRVWIGTGNGLNLFDEKNSRFTVYKHQEGNDNSICGDYIMSLYADSKNQLWVGTWNEGITIFNPDKNTYRHLRNDPINKNSLGNNNAWRIIEDREKNIWIATFGGGLDMYNPAANIFTHYVYDIQRPEGISSNRVTSLYEDGEGNMWIGTDGAGLDKLDKRTQKFTHYKHYVNTNSISSDIVNGIFPDGNDALWITTSNGLNHLDLKKGIFKTYTTKNGLPDNKMFGALKDEQQNLWISSNSGLCRFNPVNKTAENFDVTDGLQSKEFKDNAYYKLSSGEMLFGGINGFNAFYPSQIKRAEHEYPIVFTNFQVFNKDVTVSNKASEISPLTQDITDTREITLSHNQSIFSFEFALLNYTPANKKHYAYMMEGFDKEWNFNGTKNTVSYTNLNPGTYTFKVKALKSTGEWSANIASIQVKILPPFWLTWWFQLSIVLVCIIAGVLFYRFRVHNIKVQKIKLQQLVNKQTKLLKQYAIQEQKARKETDKINTLLQKKNKELEQFVYIASHDLQEPLRTTTSFVDLLQRRYKDELDENAQKYFGFIVDASVRMKALITDLLDYSRLGAAKEFVEVDANAILTNVLADLQNAIQNSNAAIVTEHLPSFPGHPVEIKQLFQNLLVNAIKFRKADEAPQIKIAVADADTHWQFSIQDNGIGIDEQFKEKIFLIFQRLHSKAEYEGSGIGLAHCKKIVELHGGHIWLSSVPGEGSIFYFTIKK